MSSQAFTTCVGGTASYPNETLEMVTDGFGTSEITNGTELFAMVYVG